MGPKAKQSPESVVREIKRNTRRKFNSEDKIKIILEGLRGKHLQKEDRYDPIRFYQGVGYPL